jgi:hypothetical protein
MNRELSRYAVKKLKHAMAYEFGYPVTAYLINAHFSACCCLAQAYHHVRARPDGMFQDGHHIRTSDIRQVDQGPDFWSFHTMTGSHYVIVTFQRGLGRTSLYEMLAILVRGVHPTVMRYQ